MMIIDFNEKYKKEVLMIIDIREGETEKTIVLVSDDSRFIRDLGAAGTIAIQRASIRTFT